VKASTVLSWLFVAAALAIYLTPPPAGVSVETMHAAALVVFTVGLWAAGALPEHMVRLLFFMLASWKGRRSCGWAQPCSEAAARRARMKPV
jgi:hypothetical protein